MVAFVRSWRLRSRLYLVWLFTRQDSFRPIYSAEVIKGDLIGQAVHLSDSGYHVAAAMLARAALEARVKRLALISPDWKSLRKSPFDRFVIHLHAVGVLTTSQKELATRAYAKLSNVCHGENHDVNHMRKLVRSARNLIREMNAATAKILEVQA